MAFLEKGITLSKNCLCYITPDKWLSKPFGKKFRSECMMSRLSHIAHAGNKVFESATVDAIITTFIASSKNINASVFIDKTTVELRNKVLSSTIAEPYYIDYLFSTNSAIITKLDSNNTSTIGSIATCENACATSDAYKLSSLIDNNGNCDSTKEYKLVNTGTISKYSNRWGEKEITYLGAKVMYPTVVKSNFNNTFGKSYINRANAKKIILKGLNLLDGFIDFRGDYIPGKTTLVVLSNDDDVLKLICALLNSKLALFYIKTKYSSSSYCGGVTFTKDMINNIPLSQMSKDDISKITNKVSEIL